MNQPSSKRKMTLTLGLSSIYKMRLLFAFLVSAYLLGGCQEGITIVVSNTSGKPTFRLEANSDATNGIEITTFSISTVAGDKPGHGVMWRVDSADGRPVRIGEIIYGTVPEGFREVTIASSLTVGEVYEAGAGMAGKIGYVRFNAR